MAETSFEPKGGNVKGSPSSEKSNTQGSPGASKSAGNDLDSGRAPGAGGSSNLSSSAGSSTKAASGGASSTGASSTQSASPLVDADRVLGKHSSTSRSSAFGQSADAQDNARFDRGADMLNRLSDRVDDFARERLDMGGIGTKAADYVYGLTDLIDSASRSFQERSPDPFRTELSNKVRRNPVKAVALSLGVGFLVGKLIK